jgi:hypothetical protein
VGASNWERSEARVPKCCQAGLNFANGTRGPPEMVLGVDPMVFVTVPPVGFPVLVEDVAEMASAHFEFNLELLRTLGFGRCDDP